MQQAVLLDMDGVLVDSEHLKAAAHAAVVRAFGGAVNADIFTHLMGRPHADVRRAYMEAGGVWVDPQRYSATYREIYNELLDEQLEMVPGSLRLLQRLKSEGYTLALVTSSSRLSVSRILTKFQLAPFFTTQVAVEDVVRGKPDPASYHLALVRLGLPSYQAVAVEDAATGIQAAAGAGLKVIAVRHRYNAGQDFSQAFTVLDSLSGTEEVIQAVTSALGPLDAGEN